MPRAAFLPCILAAVLLLTGCPAKRQAEGMPQRIVSLSPALTEMLFALNCGDRVVGRTDACNYPADAKSLPEAGHFGDPDAERVLRLKPDLILANTLVNPHLKKTFENAGIRVIVRPCETVDDYLAWLDIFERDLQASAAKQEKRQTLLLIDSFKKSSLPFNVLFLLWDDPLIAAGENTLPDTAILLAGAKNAAVGETGYFKCSREFLLTGKIDVIVWAVPKPVPDELSKRWRVYSGFSHDTLLRPGPRFLRSGVPGLANFLLDLQNAGVSEAQQP